MKKYESHSIAQTEELAGNWVNYIGDKYGQANLDQALLIGLSGHLGAGKTAFVKAVAKILGVREEITSPTFVIMKIYEIGNIEARGNDTTAIPWKRLVHIDAYRLERADELEALRFEDIVADKNNLIMVEWPEQVSLENFGENERIKFEMNDGVCSIEY